MRQRLDQLFPFYQASPAEIRAAAGDIDGRRAAVDAVEDSVKADARRLMTTVEGMFVGPAADATQQPIHHASEIREKAVFAAAALRRFALAVDAYNGGDPDGRKSVSDLNHEYATQAASDFGVAPANYPDDASEAEKDRIDKEWLQKLDNHHDACVRRLRSEFEELRGWLDDQAHDIKQTLERGPTRETLKTMYSEGVLPSWAPLVWPDIPFGQVDRKRLPYDVRDLGRLLKGVPVETSKQSLEIPLQLQYLRADITGQVVSRRFADGHVEMSLQFGGDGGASVNRRLLELYAKGGGAGQLTLSFDSRAQAQQFLDGIGETLRSSLAATRPVASVAGALTEYVRDSPAHVVDARAIRRESVGITVDDNGPVQVDAAGEARTYVDAADGEKGIVVHGEVSGHTSSGPGGSVQVTGEVQVDDDWRFSKGTLEARLSTDDANNLVDLPDVDAENVQVTWTVDGDNPARRELAEALAAGDMDRALEVASKHAKVVVRAADHDLDGGSGPYRDEQSSTEKVWVRPEGGAEYFEHTF